MRLRRKKALVEFIHKNVPVVKLGFTDICIPVMELGEGRPIISIVAGVHGNETSGLLVLDKLIQKLPSSINGQLRIIFSANPIATFENRRTNSQDNIDINRIFPGDKIDTVSHRLAHNLLELLKDSDVVIDLHSFDIETPFMGIVVLSEHTKEENLVLIRLLSPEQVWIINTESKEDKRFDKSLGVVLNNLRIPNIAVELNSPETIALEDINKCALGIIRVLAFKGLLNHPSGQELHPKFFERTRVLSHEGGIFIPKARVSDSLKKGSLIGVIRKIPEFSDIPVISPSDGELMQISRQKFILPGKEIAAIGRRWEAKK